MDGEIGDGDFGRAGTEERGDFLIDIGTSFVPAVPLDACAPRSSAKIADACRSAA